MDFILCLFGNDRDVHTQGYIFHTMQLNNNERHINVKSIIEIRVNKVPVFRVFEQDFWHSTAL